jgi:hypothetical protein
MELQYSVLIFSKYSDPCIKLFDFITQNKIDTSEIKLYSLCIDNQKLRYRILADKKIDINIVPSILSVYSGGAVKKYDGQQAFAWIESKLEQPQQVSVQPQPIQVQPIQEQPQQVSVQPQPIQQAGIMKSKQTHTSIDDIPYEDDNDEEKEEKEEKEIVLGEPIDEPIIEKPKKQKGRTSKQTGDIKSKADELARGRDIMDKEMNKSLKRK